MSFTLATDLDGTFLSANTAQGEPLYELLRSHEEATLIYVTGRGIETIRPLLDDQLIPSPDYIIADVGATVVDGRTLDPVQPLQNRINQTWPGVYALLQAIPELEELERQNVPQERRMSFFVYPEQVSDTLLGKIRAMGCHAIHSNGNYLDILPGGVNKGTTLNALVRHLGLDNHPVATAGDTLNDLAMLALDDYHAILVGNAEAKLKAALPLTPRRFQAEAHGPAGILEGLRHFGMVDIDQADAEPLIGDSDLVMVYHRLPFSEIRGEDGQVTRQRPKSPNGILPTLLGVFRSGIKGSWVAWRLKDTHVKDTHVEEHHPPLATRVPIDEQAMPGVYARCIPLSAQDVGLFYETFSKEALWPILFNFIDRASFDPAHWRHYQSINRKFAEATAKEAAHGATIWIHDYNLWLVPAYLRELRPDLRISFFHHTAFPAFDCLSVLPWWGEIVSSLLQCDYVGFHIPRYIRNFVDAVEAHCETRIVKSCASAPRFMAFGSAVACNLYPAEIVAAHRRLRLGAHPVGIHVDHVRSLMEKPETRQRIAAIEEEMRGKTTILSVERLDYVKGQLEKLAAFEKLLNDHPEMHGEVTLINICTPAAPGMTVYQTIQQDIEAAIGRINGRFGRMDWTPVRFFFRSLPFEDLMAYYGAADVAWISPLRDGLNLVAKEYVIAKEACNGKGVLLLSEFAGAAAELHGALLANPYDISAMAERLYSACHMGEAEQRDRILRMASIVEHNDISAWADGFISAVEEGRFTVPESDMALI